MNKEDAIDILRKILAEIRADKPVAPTTEDEVSLEEKCNERVSALKAAIEVLT